MARQTVGMGVLNFDTPDGKIPADYYLQCKALQIVKMSSRSQRRMAIYKVTDKNKQEKLKQYVKEFWYD